MHVHIPYKHSLDHLFLARQIPAACATPSLAFQFSRAPLVAFFFCCTLVDSFPWALIAISAEEPSERYAVAVAVAGVSVLFAHGMPLPLPPIPSEPAGIGRLRALSRTLTAAPPTRGFGAPPTAGGPQLADQIDGGNKKTATATLLLLLLGRPALLMPRLRSCNCFVFFCFRLCCRVYDMRRNVCLVRALFL